MKKITVEFADKIAVPLPYTPRQRKQKFEIIVNRVVDTLSPITLEFKGAVKTYYTRDSQKTYVTRIPYDAKGHPAQGVWKHGRSGGVRHIEQLTLDTSGRLMHSQCLKAD